MNDYRDNNNFLIHNEVLTNDYRMPFRPTNINNFLELSMSPVWNGPSKNMNFQMSIDQGKTFGPQSRIALFGTYFFVSDERKVLTRSAFKITDLVANVGGVLAILKLFIKPIAR